MIRIDKDEKSPCLKEQGDFFILCSFDILEASCDETIRLNVGINVSQAAYAHIRFVVII
jgi:hypothetical protein